MIPIIRSSIIISKDPRFAAIFCKLPWCTGTRGFPHIISLCLDIIGLTDVLILQEGILKFKLRTTWDHSVSVILFNYV